MEKGGKVGEILGMRKEYMETEIRRNGGGLTRKNKG